jgi:hypothetical protein
LAFIGSKKGRYKMLPVLKAVMLALAVSGVAAAGIVIHLPLDNAKKVLGDKLDSDSKLPENGQNGVQNALNHVNGNQDRWLENHNATQAAETPENETAEQ